MAVDPVQLADLVEAAILADWQADADFLSRGTKITAPRVTLIPELELEDELVDVAIPEVEVIEVVSVAPRYDRMALTLQVTCLVGADMPEDTGTGDPGASSLAVLGPLAIIVSQKIATILRSLANPNEYQTIGEQLEGVDFESYTRRVSVDANRNLASGQFRYRLRAVVPAFFDVSGIPDLEGADVDYEHWPDGEPPTSPPDAEDDETL